MQYDHTIVQSIKKLILEVAPEAKVFLFGSRATGNWHEESDWDVLVLMPNKIDKALKEKIRNNLFPLSVTIGSFIYALVVHEDEWLHNPSYYSLRQSIVNETIPA